MCSLIKKKVTIDAYALDSELDNQNIRIIDVRKKIDYDENHISNSVNLPISEVLHDASPDKVVKLMQYFGVDDDTHIVVYDDTFGALASRVAWNIQYMGHDNVSLLDVTYSKWIDLGLSTDLKQHNFKHKKYNTNINPKILSTVEYLEENMNNKNVVIVDNRERLNFLEQHIPGAINIPYKIFSSVDKILKPKSELSRILQNRHIDRDAEIITYCGSVGTLSGLAYYALKSIDHDNVKLYAHSFKEWKQLNKNIYKQEHANYWDLSAE